MAAGVFRAAAPRRRTPGGAWDGRGLLWKETWREGRHREEKDERKVTEVKDIVSIVRKSRSKIGKGRSVAGEKS